MPQRHTPPPPQIAKTRGGRTRGFKQSAFETQNPEGATRGVLQTNRMKSQTSREQRTRGFFTARAWNHDCRVKPCVLSVGEKTSKERLRSGMLVPANGEARHEATALLCVPFLSFLSPLSF
eukprot:6183348-Pleurochrysis_carterae.AAC.2